MKGCLFRAITKKYLSILIAMTLVASLGSGIMSGMANGVLSLKNTIDEYLQIMDNPDAVVETEVLTKEILQDISSVPGVEVVDARLVGNLVMIGENGEYYTMQAMTYSDTEFQGTYYWEKSDQETEYPILLERRFSYLNHIHAGEFVEIRIENRSWNCMVQGVISRPEMMAVHHLGDMEMQSTDIGYVYVPAEILESVDNPEFDEAASEWNEKNQEFVQKEKDAKEEYESILEDIEDAEKLLKDKQKELDDNIKSAGTKKTELLKYKEEIAKRLKELEEKEKELSDKRKQLDDADAQLQKADEELSSGKEELSKKKEELESTKNMLESKKKELTDQLAQLTEKENELQKTREEVQKAGEEIDQKRRELEETEKSLVEKREEILEQYEMLKESRELLVLLKEHLSSLDELIRKADESMDLYSWASEAVVQLDEMLSDSEAVARKLEHLRDELAKLDEEISRAEAAGLDVADKLAERQEIIDYLESVGITREKLESAISDFHTFTENAQKLRKELVRLVEESADPKEVEEIRDALIKECKDALKRYKESYNFSDAVFDGLISQIDDGLKQIDDGLNQIEDGLNQIAEGKKILAEKDKEVQDGLKQIADGEKQIQDGKAAISDGLAQIEDGLSQVKDAYPEIEKYEKQVRDGENEIRSKRAELNEYERQWAEAERILKDAREALNKSAKEVEDGIKQIDDALADGKKQLEEGQDKIKKSRNEAEEKWLDVLNQFADVRSELRKAKEELDAWDGYGNFCNQFLLKIDPDADPYAVLAEVEKVIGEDRVKNSYTYNDSALKRVINYNIDPLTIMSLYVPMLFFIVALIVECLFMSFMIRQCRREIGILRALGYSARSIILLFCGINAIVSAAGILLGVLIGFGVAGYMGYFFQGYFYLYFFRRVFHWGRFLLSALLTVLVGQIATILSAGYIGGVRPSEAMSRPAPSSSFSDEKGIFSGIQVPPFFKYCVFSLLRNKLRLVFSLVCLASTVVLIFAAVEFDFSKNRILEQLFEDRTHYDCEIFLYHEPDEDFLKRISETGLVENPEVIYYFSSEIEGNGLQAERTVKGMEAGSKLMEIYDSEQNKIDVSDEGILLEKHTADYLNVSAGDTVLVDGKEMKIVAVPDECESRFQYISMNAAKEMGSPEMCSLICDVKTENELPLMEFLSKEENYLYAAFTYKIYAGIEGGFNAFSVCAAVILVFAVSIGLVVVINTIRTNLQEQKKELCVLRTLGYQYSSLSVRLISQSLVYFVFSCIIGVPGGIVVTQFILDKLEIEDRAYPFVNDFRVYLFTLALVLAYIIFSHFISMRTIKTWDLVESVKDKE